MSLWPSITCDWILLKGGSEGEGEQGVGKEKEKERGGGGEITFRERDNKLNTLLPGLALYIG